MDRGKYDNEATVVPGQIACIQGKTVRIDYSSEDLTEAVSSNVPVSKIFFRGEQAPRHMLFPSCLVDATLKNSAVDSVEIRPPNNLIEELGVIQDINSYRTIISYKDGTIQEEVTTSIIKDQHKQPITTPDHSFVGKFVRLIMTRSYVFDAFIVNSPDQVCPGHRVRIKLPPQQTEEIPSDEEYTNRSHSVSYPTTALPTEIEETKDFYNESDHIHDKNLTHSSRNIRQCNSLPTHTENEKPSGINVGDSNEKLKNEFKRYNERKHERNQRVKQKEGRFPNKKINESDFLMETGYISSIEERQNYIYIPELGSHLKVNLNYFYYSNNEKALYTDLYLGDECTYLKEDRKIKVVLKKNLRNVKKALVTQTSKLKDLTALPKDLEDSFIDTMNYKLYKPSLKLVFGIYEYIYRSKSRNLHFKFESLLLERNKNSPGIRKMNTDIAGFLNLEYFMREEIGNNILENSVMFNFLNKYFSNQTNTNLQEVSDILSICISIHTINNGKWGRTLYTPVKDNEEPTPMIHFLMVEQKLFCLYYLEHLYVDGVNPNTLEYTDQLSVPETKYPFFYMMSNESSQDIYLDAIGAMTQELCNLYQGSSNPSNILNIWDKLNQINTKENSEQLKNTLEIISQLFFREKIYCILCSNETTEYQLCTNNCFACPGCICEIAKIQKCKCGIIDFRDIANIIKGVRIQCFYCKIVEEGKRSALFECGCILCYNCSYETIYKYGHGHFAECPYCLVAIQPNSFEASKHILELR